MLSSLHGISLLICLLIVLSHKSIFSLLDPNHSPFPLTPCAWIARINFPLASVFFLDTLMLVRVIIIMILTPNTTLWLLMLHFLNPPPYFLCQVRIFLLISSSVMGGILQYTLLLLRFPYLILHCKFIRDLKTCTLFLITLILPSSLSKVPTFFSTPTTNDPPIALRQGKCS